MHGVAIPQEVIDFVMARRGRPHAHDEFDPVRTALVVIDLQNAFMEPQVAPAYVPAATEIVPHVNLLADAIRRSGGLVVWIQFAIDDEAERSWSSWLEMMAPGPRKALIDGLRPGSRGFELHASLNIRRQDEIISKSRFSAFLPGASKLPDRLRELDIDTVVITGTLTNICCESSARDATMLNFRTIVISDANAARSDTEHNAALASIYTAFGDVMDTKYFIERLTINTANKPSAGRR